MHGGGGVSLSERRQEVALAPSDPQTFLMQLTQKTRNAQTRTRHFDWQGGGANPVSPLSTSKWVFCLDICRLYPWLVPTEAPWDCDPKKNPQSPSVPGVSPIFQLACNNSVPLCVSPATAGVCPCSHWGKSSQVRTERPGNRTQDFLPVSLRPWLCGNHKRKARKQLRCQSRQLQWGQTLEQWNNNGTFILLSEI